MTNAYVLLSDHRQTVADVGHFLNSRGLSQSEAWVSRLLAGKRQGSPEELRAVAEFFGLSPELGQWLVMRVVVVPPALVSAGAEA